jgi:hypothetical protein
MYLLPINFHVDLIDLTKSSPHFMNGYSRKVITSFAKLYVANAFTL